MFERIYFCTECGLKKYKEQVHIQYRFVFHYTTNRFVGKQRTDETVIGNIWFLLSL